MEKDIEIIRLLVQHELKIGQLYKQYAARFTEDTDFWKHIAQEEEFHAKWVEVLEKGIENNKFTVGENRFDPYLIQSSINHLNSLIVSLESVPINRKKAFETAYDYEKSMVETDFFKIIAQDSEEIKTILNKLEEATVKHAEELKEKMLELES